LTEVTSAPAGRPIVSDVQDGPTGKFFTLDFAPGQSLPTHRNSATVVISVLRGSGEISVADQGPRTLAMTGVFTVQPEVEHAVTAGPDGLELRVDLISSCCSCC
jgi:quercetin dioxygenase-like cupin family protein